MYSASSLISRRHMGHIVIVVAVLLMCFPNEVIPDASDHRYIRGDRLLVYANKIGPFRNPSETYTFFDLPFCYPVLMEEKKLTLSEALNGDRLYIVPYELRFLQAKDSDVLCRRRLTVEQVSKFRYAVMKDYYAQLYCDDLLLTTSIGKQIWNKTEGRWDQSKSRYFIYTHLLFEILYNKDTVIEINIRTDLQLVTDVTAEKEVDVQFEYTVTWKETNTVFEERMNSPMSASLPHHMEIHWFSIMNSCVTVMILVGCIVTFYFRVLKKDITKYLDDEELAEDKEETGWKYLHSDIFRHPNNKCLLAAALGCGTQLLTLVVFILILGLAGVFYPYNQGRLLTVFIFLYALTSGVAGYTSLSFYRQLEGTNWVRSLLLTGSLFSGPLFIIFCLLNSVAVSYEANAALPLDILVIIFIIWTFLAIPMLLFGGITGKNSKVDFETPCPTTKWPREVPLQRWYHGILPQMVLGGILPLTAVHVQLYDILASIWGHRIYTIYLILCIVFVFVLLVTALVCVALTYLQLAVGNHQWWWRSFLCGGSAGFFIYCYSLYYYFDRSDVSGFVQTSFFIGYMACICYGIFLMLGTVGFHVSLLLVRYIYASIKSD